MRVIAGEARGRIVRAPKGLRTRPVTEKVKEAIFDVLGSQTEEARVLDLFAGSGSLGIEALSRGAREVVFVDTSPLAKEAIEKNLKMLQWESRAKVLCLESCVAIKKLAEKGERFDIIFSDPPYRERISVRILQEVSGSGILAVKAVVVTRFRKDEQIPDAVAGLSSIVQKSYGDSRVIFWAVRQAERKG
ncbi:MAG: 16S rRNA (guanine(966)-N(2))-methyltransferase RsmD [Candidatus Latescibacterota bacterium]|nr:MAG: 16S rRNA (guanine(966)-N(2))-methyltransferase RsmD [Candidatus Latescibacterota bacterium]